MTRHVFSNSDMVTHIWAQRDHDHGRNGTSNSSFRGGNLYSYRALIARFVADKDGNPVALISSDKWTVTTSRHQHAARMAVPATIPQFCVPHLGEIYGGVNDDLGHDHARNIAAYLSEYRDDMSTARRARDISGPYAQHAGRAALAYAETFGLTRPDIDVEGDWKEYLAFRAARDARLNTPQNVAKRAADRDRREANKLAREARARAAALLENNAAIAAWRTGERSYLPYGAREALDGGAMLRVRGDVLETSMGASVPLSHAIKVFRLARIARETATPWHRNGNTVRVGNFHVDVLESDGTIRAGCHTIHWPEIEQAALIAGVA